MKFGNLHYLWLLLVIPILVIFYIHSFKRKKNALALFAHNDVLARLLVWVSFPRQYFKAGLLCVGILMIIFSLIEPKWGYQWQEIKRRGIDIVIAVDVSKSMLAADIKPNRLERAKLEIGDLLNHLHGDRIGLVAFAGTAFLQCPLTLDYGALKMFLDRVDTNLISRGGTDIGGAIKRAQGAFPEGENKYKIIILITDGEDLEGNAVKLAEKAKNNGIKIFTVGLGNTQGVPIPMYNENGNKSYLKDRSGQMVLSKLDEITLQKIALFTGGSYVNGSSAEGLGLIKIYKEKVLDLEKKELKSTMQKRYENRYQIPLLFGILLVVSEFFVSEKKKVKKHEQTT